MRENPVFSCNYRCLLDLHSAMYVLADLGRQTKATSEVQPDAGGRELAHIHCIVKHAVVSCYFTASCCRVVKRKAILNPCLL